MSAPVPGTPAASPVVTRFAPSPTGYLHLGHAFSALDGWRRARQAGGQFLLRIEDIDPTRCRPAFVEAAMEDLAWLGVEWDGPVRVQSAHLGDYARSLDALGARGLIYPCFCSRADILREIARSSAAPHAPDGSALYPGTCRSLSEAERRERIAAGEHPAFRLDMARAMRHVRSAISFHEEGEGRLICHPEAFGDVVLGRKDAPASYHLCVTHDDAVQGVSLVTRGVDLRPATDIHRLIQTIMGWPEPAYAHHRLLVDAEGRRLAKRDGAAALRDLRRRGVAPSEVREMYGLPSLALKPS